MPGRGVGFDAVAYEASEQVQKFASAVGLVRGRGAEGHRLVLRTRDDAALVGKVEGEVTGVVVRLPEIGELATGHHAALRGRASASAGSSSQRCRTPSLR